MRNKLPHVRLGDLASTRRALDEIEGAMDVLARRWYCLDPGTREAAPPLPRSRGPRFPGG